MCCFVFRKIGRISNQLTPRFMHQSEYALNFKENEIQQRTQEYIGEDYIIIFLVISIFISLVKAQNEYVFRKLQRYCKDLKRE